MRRTVSYVAVALSAATATWFAAPHPARSRRTGPTSGRSPTQLRWVPRGLAGDRPDARRAGRRRRLPDGQPVGRQHRHPVARRRTTCSACSPNRGPAAGPAASSTATATSSPTTTSSRTPGGSRSPCSTAPPTRPSSSAPTQQRPGRHQDRRRRRQARPDCLGRLEPAAGRRAGLRHRQPVRPGADADDRHRQQPEPLAPHGEQPHGPWRHPDGRGDQPGQLRRPAARQARGDGRDHDGHRQPVGLERRRRAGDPVGGRPAGRRRIDQKRPDDPPGLRHLQRLRDGQGAAGQPGDAGRGRGEGRHARPAGARRPARRHSPTGCWTGRRPT